MMLFVRIKPNQRFDEVEKISGQWQIRLKAPAIDGKANEYLIKFLSEVLRIPMSAIRIKKGLTSRLKYLDIDADQEDIEKKMAAARKAY